MDTLESNAKQLVSDISKLKKQIADKEEKIKIGVIAGISKKSSIVESSRSSVRRSPGFSDESRFTEQKLSTLIDNVFRDLKNQFDAVADTQMTKDIQNLVATLNSPNYYLPPNHYRI